MKRLFSRPGGRRGERGAAAVEFALVLPMLLLLLFGIIDVGYMLNRDTMINNVSRDAARIASLGGTYAEISASINSDLAGYGIPSTAPTTVIVIDCVKGDGTACNATSGTYDTLAVPGATVTIRITYVHTLMSPLMRPILGSSVTLTKQTRMRIE